LARVLIVGCGCRGRELATALVSRGHAVRGTTREPRGVEEIAAAGAEPYVGDPDRVATLMGALDGVAVVCWLLGRAQGTPAQLAQLHGPRLRFLLERLVDTGVRGFVHEPVGEEDSRIVRAAAETWRIPVAILDPAGGWPQAPLDAIGALVDSPE
jgi:uncharacterized protein YbjT (DUF2867 family)